MENLVNVESEGNAPSVASTARWRCAFFVLFVLVLLVRVWLSAQLPLFGDEAFYWLESRYPAWGYSDLPGMTAWLIGLGTMIGGNDLWAVRSLFLWAGLALPWLVVVFARRHFAPQRAWQAGLLALSLPLLSLTGVLALPDMPLTFAAMLALLALDAVRDDDRWRHWLLLAAALMIAQASHYRAAMLLLAGLVYVLATPDGRQFWRRPRWYVCLLLGSAGALPMTLYNVRHHWSGLDFQALERNPWVFQPVALLEPLWQALVVTPLLYLMLLWALLLAFRRARQGAPWDLIAWVSATLLVGYFLLGLFADNQRFHAHWPLPGYLPLLALVPMLAHRLWQSRLAGRVIALLAWIGLGAAHVVVVGLLVGLSLPPGQAQALRQLGVAEVFTGWRPAGELTKQLLGGTNQPYRAVVADNFRLAAQLAFSLGDGRAVYSLDSPLNHKHGRSVQLHDWGLDEAGLFATHGGQRVLLVVEETALRAHQAPDWLGSVCNRFEQLQPLARVDVSPNKRLAFYAARLRLQPDPTRYFRDHCVVWRRAYAKLQGLE